MEASNSRIEHRSSKKISVVTAVYNRVQTVGDCIQSVMSQTVVDQVEHIIVDGNSTDGTEEALNPLRNHISKWIREPDDGIYDALNKGIRAATTSIVGFLHADDQLADPRVLERVIDLFNSSDVDAVYGDLVYVDAVDPDRVIRYWKSGEYSRPRFRRGWMPPHPTVYIRKSVYEKLGMFRTDLGSAADYECLVRLLYKGQIKVGYLPSVLVRMRVGGKSNASLANRLVANQNDRRAWMVNGLQPPWGLRITKPLRKLRQYVTRPPADR